MVWKIDRLLTYIIATIGREDVNDTRRDLGGFYIHELIYQVYRQSLIRLNIIKI